MPKRKIENVDGLSPNEMLGTILENDGTKDEDITEVEPKQTKKVNKKTVTAKQAKESTPKKNIPKKMGRPATGKSNNDDYQQVTLYIEKESHRAARRRMIDLEGEGEKLDFSEYVNKLIKEDAK